MRVAIIGTGYVGLTTCVAMAYLNHEVVGVDVDPKKLEALRRGKSPIHEPGIQKLLDQVGENVCFTDKLADAIANADIIMIAVGTPPKRDGDADASYVEEAARQVAQGLQPKRTYTLVVKSTVPIGTNRRVANVITRALSERQVKTKIHLASNPEFLQEGLALRGTFYPDRIVVGVEESEGVEALRRLYRPILEQTFEPPSFLPRREGYSLPPLITTDPTSAEMIKYAANTFLTLKISFINEIAGLCEKVGADVTEVSRGIGLDTRIGQRFLEAGLGWGGSCFPKDTAALLSVAGEYGYTMQIVQAAREVNWRQRQLIVEKLQSALKILRGRTIGILGLTFKPNTDDVREAPAMDIIRALIGRGAHVQAHDPIAIPHARKLLKGLDVAFEEDVYRLADGADALVLVTGWETYHSLDLAELGRRMNNRVLVDGRNFFVPDDAHTAGFVYMGVGR